jgi:hypothetical protein
MYWKKPQIIRWGRLNLVHNVMEKMLKTIRKDGMNGQTKSQALELGPTQDLIHVMTIRRHMHTL